MEMKLEDLDIDDVGLDEDITPEAEFDEGAYEKPWLDGSVPQGEEIHEDEPSNEPTEDDIITTLLKDKGINPDAIKFENEAGEIEEKSFNELSREEQLQILNYDESNDDYGLAEDEVSLINELRENNLHFHRVHQENDGSEHREDRGIHCTYYPRFGKCDSYGGSDVCHFLLIKCMVDSGVFDSCRIKPFPAIFQFYGKESEGVYACLLRCTGKDEYFCCTICSWNAYSKDFWAKCILVPPVQCRDTGIQDICFEML